MLKQLLKIHKPNTQHLYRKVNKKKHKGKREENISINYKKGL